MNTGKKKANDILSKIAAIKNLAAKPKKVSDKKKASPKKKTRKSSSSIQDFSPSLSLIMNADKSEAILNGKAFVDVVSVDELKHYAKDGGKSAAEIAKITKPEVTYSFLADGVYIKK